MRPPCAYAVVPKPRPQRYVNSVSASCGLPFCSRSACAAVAFASAESATLSDAAAASSLRAIVPVGAERLLRRGLGLVDGAFVRADDGLLRRALLSERGLLPLGRRELLADGRERALRARRAAP